MAEDKGGFAEAVELERLRVVPRSAEARMGGCAAKLVRLGGRKRGCWRG